MYYFSRDSLYGANSRTMGWSFELGSPGAEYKLRTEEAQRFREFWKNRETSLVSLAQLPPRIQVAFEYFNSSYKRIPQARFLDLSIALEALFDIQFEQTYRLPLRVAALVASTREDTTKLYEEVKTFAKIRNKIAHGDKQLKEANFQTDVRNKLPLLRNVVRQAILRHIDLFAERGDLYEKLIHEDFEREFILQRLVAE